MRIIPLIIFPVLAACSPPAPESPAPESPALESPAPKSTAPESPASESRPAIAEGTMMTSAALVGEYRVAGVDGQDINLPHGISASISDDEIEVQSQCIRFKWAYTLVGEVLAASRVPVTSCQRGLLPEEDAIARAFDQAAQARRTSANGIEFSGAGHTVTLFSQ